AEPRSWADVDADDREFGLTRHLLLDCAPRFVQLLECGCKRARLSQRVGEETTNADAHVVEPTSRIEARAERKADVRGGQRRRRSARGLAQCANTRPRPTRSDPPQALLNEDAVVAVQRHDVGNRA